MNKIPTPGEVLSCFSTSAFEACFNNNLDLRWVADKIIEQLQQPRLICDNGAFCRPEITYACGDRVIYFLDTKTGKINNIKIERYG